MESRIMTVPAFAKPFGDGLPSESDRDVARQLRGLVVRQAQGDVRISLREPGKAEPTEITLTPAMSIAFLELLRPISDGDAVTIIPVGKELTTQQAADILNVSRPFLISLLRSGEIAHTLVGRHRRIRAVDLFSYKTARNAKRAAALDELMASDADLV
jgi:excisionase family DNA binding protein